MFIFTHFLCAIRNNIAARFSADSDLVYLRVQGSLPFESATERSVFVGILCAHLLLKGRNAHLMGPKIDSTPNHHLSQLGRGNDHRNDSGYSIMHSL